MVGGVHGRRLERPRRGELLVRVGDGEAALVVLDDLEARVRARESLGHGLGTGTERGGQSHRSLFTNGGAQQAPNRWTGRGTQGSSLEQ